MDYYMTTYYTKEHWKELNEKYPRESIINRLITEILNGKIEYPIKKITYEECIESFVGLQNYKCNPVFTGDVYSRYEYKYPLSGRYIDEVNSFNDASNYFHQENRWKCDSINSPSPYRTWNNEKFLRTLLPALWSMKVEEITDQSLRMIIGMRKYIASQFKPTVAKSIYEKYNSRNVLDFSAGWGDRFAGFCACENTNSYVGIDPNVNLHHGYMAQAQDYNVSKTSYFVEGGAEDVVNPVFDTFTYDTIFTSPPYFDVERYTRDSNQSWKKYKKLNDWLNGFLFKTLNRYWEQLSPNGHLIINISDVYAHHTVNKICDPMNDFISTLPNAEFVEGLGMKMAKRPNSKAVRTDGVFVEPIWIWRKI